MSGLAPPGFIHEYGGDGASVVLVGEILSGHLSWARHAERLLRRWRVIGITPLITALAAGGVQHPKDWSISMESRSLEKALHDAGVHRVHLVGWSLGASIALEPANRNYETRIFGPDQVEVQGKLVGLIRRYH